MVSKRFRNISLQQLSIPTSNGVVTFSDKDGELAVILKKKNGEEKKISFDLENKKIKASDLELDDGTSVKTNTSVVDGNGKIKNEVLPIDIPRKNSDGKIDITDLPDTVPTKGLGGKISEEDLPDTVPVEGEDGVLRVGETPVITGNSDGTIPDSALPSFIPRKVNGRLDVEDLPNSVVTGDFDDLFDTKFGTKGAITGDFDDLFDTKFGTKGAVTGDFGSLFDERFGTKGAITGDFGSLFDTRFGTKGVVTDSNIADRVSSNLPSNVITTLNISNRLPSSVVTDSNIGSKLPSSVVTDSNIGNKLPSNVITDSNIASKVSSNLPTSVVTTNNIADSLPSGLVYESGLSSLLQNSDATYGTVDATTVNVDSLNVKPETSTRGILYAERSDIIIRYVDNGIDPAGSLRFRQGNNNASSGLFFFSGNSSDTTVSTNKWWQIRMDALSNGENSSITDLKRYALIFKYKNAVRGYINEGTSPGNNLNNFTGQHRNISDDLDLYSSSSIGLIAVSNGEYNSTNSNSITINEALPKISLSNTRNQKNVFGVISNKEDETKDNRTYEHGNFVSVFDKPADDNRLIVNSVGEGGIWVSNVNGDLENGDYITTCEIPGYGMKQDSEFLANYTVAKITCDCNFDLSSPIYICQEFEWEGQIYRRAFVGCTYHCG